MTEINIYVYSNYGVSTRNKNAELQERYKALQAQYVKDYSTSKELYEKGAMTANQFHEASTVYYNLVKLTSDIIKQLA